MLSETAKYIYKKQKEADSGTGNHIGGKADFVMDDDDAWDIDMIEVREELP